MTSRILLLVTSLLTAASPLPAQTIDLATARIVDLTHPMDERTLYWPTSPSAFELKELSYGRTEGGYFYSSYAFCTPEHGGTHLDAPIHFAEGGRTAGEIPVSQLVGPAVVIDITRQSAADPVYRLSVDDVLAHEREHGRIPEGAIVLARTGWSRFWPDRKAYFGDDTPGDASKLRFPGFSAEAVKLLVERKVGALGIDTASLDYGPSTDFMAHRVGAAAGVPNLENLTNLDQLPPRGAVVVALPVKVARGSGGPVRVIALVP
ncbi:MAG TPA: cyclase family protein [Vicinamibacterales bacterium]